MKRQVVCLLILLMLTASSAKRHVEIIWQKVFGGSGGEWALSIAPAPGGGYIVAGDTDSKDGDVKTNHGNDNAWVIKVNGDGNLIWKKTYGGSDWDSSNAVVAAPDGGYIVAGWTCSIDGDLKGIRNKKTDLMGDLWIMKLDRNGNIVWQETFGGSDDDIAQSVTLAPDGGCVVAGKTMSRPQSPTIWRKILSSFLLTLPSSSFQKAPNDG